jgi:hypothetical protein
MCWVLALAISVSAKRRKRIGHGAAAAYSERLEDGRAAPSERLHRLNANLVN